MEEVVKGRAPDSMDTLVQQTESPFMAEVLHFPLPAKFRMPLLTRSEYVRKFITQLPKDYYLIPGKLHHKTC